MNYFYIENINDLKKHYPYEEKHIKVFPEKYPCILSVDLIEDGLAGNFYKTEFIYDMSDFIYENGCLYIKCNL